MTPPAVAAASATIEISAAGSGSFGRVRSTPAGLDCNAPPCRAAFALGGTVTLQAFTEPGAFDGFAGWSGACGGLEACSVTLSGDVSISAHYEPANRVFVVSSQSDGNFGGIAGADAECAALARPAGIMGQVRAWLSDSRVNAIDRLQGSRGWVRMDGQAFVDTLTALQVGIATTAFTGTAYDGTASGTETCQDWTSGAVILGGIGDPNRTGGGFTSSGSASCAEQRHLYCFEMGKSVRISPTPVVGRVAFIGTAPLDSGIAAADAACQAQAPILQPGATFKALVASVGASPASRFNISGLPWVRLDGVPIMATAAAFFQTDRWDSAPNLVPGGLVGDHTIMAGGTSLLEPGTNEDTCANWTSTADTPMTQGRSQASDPSHYFYGDEVSATTCAQRVYSLLCMQE
jgi:hypothetical protein